MYSHIAYHKLTIMTLAVSVTEDRNKK